MNADILAQLAQLHGVSTDAPKEAVNLANNPNEPTTGRKRVKFINPIEFKSFNKGQKRFFRLSPFSKETQRRAAHGDDKVTQNRIEYSTVWFTAQIEQQDGSFEPKKRMHVIQMYAPLIPTPITVPNIEVIEASVKNADVEITESGVTFYPYRDVSHLVTYKTLDGQSHTLNAKGVSYNVAEEDGKEIYTDILVVDPRFDGDEPTKVIDSHLAVLIEEYKETGDPTKIELHNDFLHPGKFYNRVGYKKDRKTGKSKQYKRPVTVDDPITMQDLRYNNNSRGVIVQVYEVASSTEQGEYIKMVPKSISPERQAEIGSPIPFEFVETTSVGELSIPTNNGERHLLNIRRSGDRAMFGESGLFRQDGLGQNLFKITEGRDFSIEKVVDDQDKVSYKYFFRLNPTSIQGVNPITALENPIDPFASFLDANNRSALLIESYKKHMGLVDEDEDEELPFDADEVDMESSDESFGDQL